MSYTALISRHAHSIASVSQGMIIISPSLIRCLIFLPIISVVRIHFHELVLEFRLNTLSLQMYLTKHRVDHNWRCLEISPPHRLKTLKGHDDHVVTCLQFSGNRVVSGSDDNTLRVWNAITGKVHLTRPTSHAPTHSSHAPTQHLRQLIGHTGGVWCSQFDGSTVVSGSTDRTLMVRTLCHDINLCNI